MKLTLTREDAQRLMCLLRDPGYIQDKGFKEFADRLALAVQRGIVESQGAKIEPETYPGVTNLFEARWEYQRLLRADDLGGESEKKLLRLWPEAKGK